MNTNPNIRERLADDRERHDGATSNALEDLGADLRGKLVRPRDGEYDAVRAVFNGMIDRRPLAVVRCAGASDVVRGIAFARQHDLAVSVRGGGHNVAATRCVTAVSCSTFPA